MTNRVVDGFAHYGTVALAGASTPANAIIKNNLLAGAYAELTPGQFGIVQLPWDLANSDLYFAISANNSVGTTGLRRVLPSSYSPVILSAYFALDKLPASNKTSACFDFRDGANTRITSVYINSTGSIAVGDPATGVELVSTSGPVLVAETATHIEIKLSPGAGATGAIEVWANGTKVIDAAALTFPTGANACAQITLGSPKSLDNAYIMYFSNLIIRDTAGSVNNAITGDRKVATLLVDSIDAGHQGWTKRPLHRFGNGILDVTPNVLSAVYAGTSSETDLGSVDFTVEAQIRFKSLPTGSNKAHIFGKWDSNANARSYQLYLGGPSLDNGNITYRISTDGTSGTTVNKISVPWSPNIGEWYHVAVERIAGVTSLYIDGIKQGLSVSDASFYFNGTGRASLGAQLNTTTGATGTGLDGWVDEYRETKGSYRYGGNFAPPTDSFPRGPIADAQWSDVYWLSGWNSATIADDSGYARTLTAINSAAAITPGDGGDAYQVLNKTAPDDTTFIEAALLAATATYTQNTPPANNDTVTVNGHVYTFKTTLTGAADEVLIGATADTAANNLAQAINAGSGAGTLYGAGTVANADVTAVKWPTTQVVVTAQTAGTVGNALTVSTTSATGTWGPGVTHLSGGTDIPAYSQFGFHNLPAGASQVDSVTIVRRSWKTDSGLETTRASLVGIGGGVLNGASINDTTVPILYHDTFEVDPDTSGALTPTAVNAAMIKIDRTV